MKGRIAKAVVVALTVGLLAPIATDLSSASALATPTPTPTPWASHDTSPSAPTPSPAASQTPAPVPSVPAEEAREEDENIPGFLDEPSSSARTLAPLAVATVAEPTVPTAARVAGSDRFATSIAASKAAFPSGASTVLVVNGLAPVDGTIAASMAAQLGAPLLYVRADSVPAVVGTELARLAPQSIVVVGGAGVVNEAVLTQLRTVAADVRRFGGANRYETSRSALTGRGGTFATVYVAGGANLIDAPLASVTAAATDGAALLVNGTSALDEATVAALRTVGVRSVVIVGGVGTVSAAYEAALRSSGFTVARRAAKDRYAQTVLMAAERPAPAARAIVANPATTADVAVATALAAVTRQALYYSTEKCVPDVVSAHLAGIRAPITGVGGVYWLEAPVLANAGCAAVKSNLQSQLNSAIRSTMSRYAGTYSVTVRQLGGLGEVTHVDGGTRREPASMLKIFAAWAAYKRIELGHATTSTVLPSGVPLGTCIRIMIHVSDNYCHTDIAHWIGIPRLNAMIRDAGFVNTFYGSVPLGTSVLYAGNRSTSNDLSLLMSKLSGGSILSKRYVDALFSVMGIQIGRSRIASGIPPVARQVSKPGALWVASGLLQGDTAIVYGTRYTYALSIIGDEAPPTEAFRAISRTVYEHFHGPFGAAASYPREQMTTTKPVGLRSSAGGTVVVTVPAGTNVEQLDSIRDWYIVQYGSRKLWVYFTGLRNR